MRKLIMLVALSGATFSHKIGDEVEFEDDEAERLVDAKYAKYADESKLKYWIYRFMEWSGLSTF